jgi:preprotein translocase subunit SecA
MIENIIKAIFGDPDKKKIAYYTSILEEIKKFENSFSNFSFDDIKAKTTEFKKLFEGLDFEKEEDSKKIKNILKEILPQAFANLKQATKLLNNQEFELSSGKKVLWNMIPYDVQLIG